MYGIRKQTRERRDEIESLTQETLSISGIVLMKSFVREPFEKDAFFPRLRPGSWTSKFVSRWSGRLVPRRNQRDGDHRAGAGVGGGGRGSPSGAA